MFTCIVEAEILIVMNGQFSAYAWNLMSKIVHLVTI